MTHIIDHMYTQMSLGLSEWTSWRVTLRCGGDPQLVRKIPVAICSINAGVFMHPH